MRVEKGDTVQASAAGRQLSLLSYDVVRHEQDLAALQALARQHLVLLFFLLLAGVEDADPLAAVAENGNPLQALLIGVHVEALRLLHRKSVRDVDRGTDGRVDVGLPYGLHVNPLAVTQGHGRHEIIRQFGIASQPVLLHIGFHDLRVYFIINVRSVQGLGLPLVVVRIHRFDPAGDAEHGGKGSRRGDGQKLGVAKPVLAHQLPCLLRCIRLKIRRGHDLVDIAFFKRALLFCKHCGSGDGGIRHGEPDVVAHFNGVLFPVGQAQFDQAVRKAHDAQADLAPLAHALLLFFQRMERKALLQHFIERADGHFHTVLQALKIKLRVVCKRILHKLGKVDASEQTASARRQRLLRARIHAGIGKLRRIAQQVPALDPVPEKSARLRIVPVRLGDPVEQGSGVDRLLDHFPGGLSRIPERIVFIVLHRFHEIFVDADRNIRLGHFLQIRLQVDELFHIRMGAVDGDHQRAATAVLADQRRHQRIQLHK